METKTIRRAAVSLLMLAATTMFVPAKKFELHPYVGGYFPDSTDAGDLRSEGIYGVKGGFFITNRIELEGNFGYLNHFALEDVPSTRGILYEANGLYHLPIYFHRMQPFLSAGVGAITAFDSDDSSESSPALGHGFEGGDTFFTFNYGGGVKATRLWGPIGLRTDVRGRTLPNLHGESVTWLELTGGILFSWGER